jgi:hypothetical protein
VKVGRLEIQQAIRFDLFQILQASGRAEHIGHMAETLDVFRDHVFPNNRPMQKEGAPDDDQASTYCGHRRCL